GLIMKRFTKRTLSALLAFLLVCSLFGSVTVQAANPFVTDPTGYTKASDVEYVIKNGTVVNWGARGEACVFLTTYANAFYTGSNTYDTLSTLSGSKYQNEVPNSDLYKTLQTLMKSKHTNVQNYQDTRPYYKYTDCISNDYSLISTFYIGALVNSEWNGQTYNREHIWPDSKCLSSGRSSNDSADIMTLRPTTPSENGSRGNKAYGVSSGFVDPGKDVRGDCARMLLYTYVRWGNTGKMWGSAGVIENQNILFQWMTEDPVDTWEMARNDSVQSITGTRNVFVDYPELAYLMFGREIPSNMVTPSGIAKNGGGSSTPACSHAHTEVRGYKAATCTKSGYTGDTYCTDCEKLLKSGTTIAAAGHKNANGDNLCDVCGAALSCAHQETELRGAVEASCTAEGFTGDTVCKACGAVIEAGQVIPMTAHTEQIVNAKEATCCEDGFTGDTICAVCGGELDRGESIPATGTHSFGDWVVTKEPTATESGSKERVCSVGGYKETAEIPPTGQQATDPDSPSSPASPSSPTSSSASGKPDGEETENRLTPPEIAAGGVGIAAILFFLIAFFLKKKKKEQYM
ncbi:MAG: endonuclease, partial [Firmicutes bacterium]|nr:endonuclease [Bacillota bacterium]